MESQYHIVLSKITRRANRIYNLKKSFEFEKKTHVNKSPHLFGIIEILDSEYKNLRKSLRIHNINFKKFYINGNGFSITIDFRFSKYWNNLMLWLNKI